MLPSTNRLRKRSGFGKVYSRGRSYVTDLVVVYVLPNKGQNTRIGFSVSKKLGNAVARNRVKRLLREAVRSMLPGIRIGVDIVVVARSKASNAPLADLTAALSGLFVKSGVLDARKL